MALQFWSLLWLASKRRSLPSTSSQTRDQSRLPVWLVKRIQRGSESLDVISQEHMSIMMITWIIFCSRIGERFVDRPSSVKTRGQATTKIDYLCSSGYIRPEGTTFAALRPIVPTAFVRRVLRMLKSGDLLVFRPHVAIGLLIKRREGDEPCWLVSLRSS